MKAADDMRWNGSRGDGELDSSNQLSAISDQFVAGPIPDTRHSTPDPRSLLVARAASHPREEMTLATTIWPLTSTDAAPLAQPPFALL